MAMGMFTHCACRNLTKLHHAVDGQPAWQLQQLQSAKQSIRCRTADALVRAQAVRTALLWWH